MDKGTVLEAPAVMVGASLSLVSILKKSLLGEEIGECAMFRKILIILVMTPLIIAAASSDTSFPVLLMMISLLLIALLESSARNEQLD